MNNVEIAEYLGKLVHENLPLHCPLCSKTYDKKTIQPMDSFAENREVLFCPHCNLEVELIILKR